MSNISEEQIREKKVCIVGLGYVGAPLAEAFARHLFTIGFDIDEKKVQALRESGSKNSCNQRIPHKSGMQM